MIEKAFKMKPSVFLLGTLNSSLRMIILATLAAVAEKARLEAEEAKRKKAATAAAAARRQKEKQRRKFR